MTILGRISHVLNTVFRCPHPGIDAIQGPCGCKENDGPWKHNFGDFVTYLVTGKK